MGGISLGRFRIVDFVQDLKFDLGKHRKLVLTAGGFETINFRTDADVPKNSIINHFTLFSEMTSQINMSDSS